MTLGILYTFGSAEADRSFGTDLWLLMVAAVIVTFGGRWLIRKFMGWF